MNIKFIFPIILAIFLGYFCGFIVFKEYKSSDTLAYANNQAYFLQYGVFSSKDSLNTNTNDLKSFVKTKEKDKYHVYVGITRDKANMEKIKGLYQVKGYDLYTKVLEIKDLEFINNLDQYDLLLNSAKTNEEIESILKTILSSYEEIENK